MFRPTRHIKKITHTIMVLCGATLFLCSYKASANGLLEAVYLGLKNDTVYLVDNLNADFTKAQIAEGWSNSHPKIDLSARRRELSNEKTGAADIISNGQSISQDSRSRYRLIEYELRFSQIIYDQAVVSFLDESKHILEGIDYQKKIKHQEALLRISSQYFDAAHAQQVINYSLQQKQALESQLNLAEKQYEVGLVSQSLVEQIKAAFDLSEVDYINAMNLFNQQIDRLVITTGTKFAKLKSVTNSLVLQIPDPADSEYWVSTALSQNPNYLAAKSNYASAHYAVRRTEAGHLPRVTFNANIKRSDAKYDTYSGPRTSFFDPNGENDDYGFEFRLDIPLYNAPVVAAIDSAVIQRDIARENLKGTQLTIKLETKTAYNNVILSINRVKALEQALVSNKLSEKTVRNSFKVGSSSSTDLINALALTKEAEQNLSRARYDYLLSIFTLYSLAGKLSAEVISEYSKFLQ